MLTRLTNYMYKLLDSFWLVPTVMAALGVLSAYMFITLDSVLADMGLGPILLPLVTGGTEGARATLSAVSSSMVTVVSVTFSVTMVALTMASSQFGPRLLGTILRDRKSQACLGAFLLTYLHSLLVLHSLDAFEPVQGPRLAVAMGLVLGVGSFFVLIYFIQHVALSIKADQVIALVYDDLRDNIQRLYPREFTLEEMHEARKKSSKTVHESKTPWDVEPALPKEFQEQAYAVRSKQSGYVQALSVDWILNVAQSNNVVVQMLVRPGDFLMAGGRIAQIWPYEKHDEALEDRLRSALVMGADRTLYQDLEYAILQLVEVALRALSPGINDPHTAIACVDRLGVALADLARRNMGTPWRVNEQGRVRVKYKTFTFEGAVDASFHKIRQAMGTSPTVGIRMLEVLSAVADVAPRAEQRASLLEQGRMVLGVLERILHEENDIIDARKRLDTLRRVSQGLPAV